MTTIVSEWVILRPTVSRSVCFGVKPPSGAYDQNRITVRQLWVCWCGGALSDERTGLWFTIAAGPRQSSHFRALVPWHSWSYFTVLDSRLSFSSPPTTRRVTMEVFDPASTQGLVLFCSLTENIPLHCLIHKGSQAMSPNNEGYPVSVVTS
jgi:hypothetical protein